MDCWSRSCFIPGSRTFTTGSKRCLSASTRRSTQYRGAQYKVDLIPKIRLEVLVSSKIADQAIKVITEAARTGNIGDGKVWATSVDSVTRVRTGESGEEAI